MSFYATRAGSLVFRHIGASGRFCGARNFADASGAGKEFDPKSYIEKTSSNLPDILPKKYEKAVAEKSLPPSVAVEGAVDDCTTLSGVPDEHIFNRRVRICMPSRAQTQSGNYNTLVWKIEPENRERWENPLMGWSSSGDPLSNISMTMDFASKEDAIRFCMRQGWEYEVEEPNIQKLRPKAYGSNFSWNKSTRITTK